MDRVCIPPPYRLRYPINLNIQRKTLQAHNYEGLQLPGHYRNADPNSGVTDRNVTFGFDDFASSALNIYRDSYQPATTAGTHEFAVFFSKDNYTFLHKTVQKALGGEFVSEALMEKMSYAYSMLLPRSDPTDRDRLIFTPEVTKKYVAQLNKFTLENLIPELREAKKLQETFFATRDRMAWIPEIMVDNRAGISSTQATDYLLPI